MDEVTVNVGKNGVSEELLSELEAHLRKRGRVRVKFLKAARAGKDREELASELSRKTSADVTFSRGNVIVLEKRR
jgi:RNA-binding protein